MSTRMKLLVIILSSILLLTLGSSWSLSTPVLALPLNQDNNPDQVTIAYPGRLTDVDGQPVVDGEYTFAFRIFTSETDDQELWSEVHEGVLVRDGTFSVSLGSFNPLPIALLEGGDLWLSTNVRAPDETDFTALEPRQALRADSSTPLAGTTAGPSCPHDHVGEEWYANIPWSSGAFKVYNYGNGPSIWGWNGGNGNGIRGYATGTGVGVYGESQNSGGVTGRSTSGNGVEAYSTNGYGLFTNSNNNDSIHVSGAGQYALNIESSGYSAIYIGSSGGSGIYVNSAGGDGMTIYSATYDGIGVYSAGDDGVHVRPTIGGVCYRCGWKDDEGFVVLNTGEVRSSVGYGALGREFAVMMDVTGDKLEYESGDVLVASSMGTATLERTTLPYSPAVVGVYSASPAFLGGQSVADEQTSGVPVTIMGVVSCKVSAENGSIMPGDLLVTSTTPGYAMRADNPTPGTILGKALGSLENGVGTILVLLTLQ